VGEVTGILIDDPEGSAGTGGNGLHDLADVTDAGGKRLRTVGPHRIAGEDVTVILEVRAAPGGVHDHLRIVAGERVDVEAGELARPLALARVRVEGATAGLLLGDADHMAVALEEAHGGAFGISECLAHDATREKAHIGAFAMDAAKRRALGGCRERRGPADAAGQTRGQTREAETRADVRETRG